MSIISNKPFIPSALLPANIPFAGGLESDDLSFRTAIRILQKKKYLVLGLAIAGGVLALTFSYVVRPYYSTMATIEIEKQQSDPLDSALGQIASGLGGSDDTKTEIQTQVSVLQSEALALETAERARFEEHNKPRWNLFGRSGRLPQEQGLPLKDAPAAREDLLKIFNSRLAITPIPDTRLIQVAFEDPDPRYAAAVTNELIDQFISDRLARRNSSTLQASEWMSSQIADLNKEVEAAQQRLIDYQKQSGLIVFPASSSGSGSQSGPSTVSSPALDRLMQLNKDLVSAREARIVREAVYEVAKSGNPDALANMAEGQLASSAGDSAQTGMFAGLLNLRQQQVALKLQLTSAAQTYAAKNPHLTDLHNQLDELDVQIKDEVQRIINRAGLDYEMAQKSEDGLRAIYENEEHEANDVNDAQIRLAVLQQEADSTRILYQDLFTKLQESKLSVGTQSSNVSVISGALAPAKPAHPKKIMNTAIGIAAGLFFGVVMAFVLDNLDNSIVTSSQVEELTGVPVLGIVPQFELSARGYGRKNSPSPAHSSQMAGAWIIAQPNSEAAESYRALRTTLLLSQPGSPPRTILVTSSVPKEGKSTTTYNLGACFAALGTRVLALDADLRKPSLHRMSGKPNSKGLSNLLTSPIDPREVIIRDTNIENMHVLPAGPAPPNPAELLGSPAFVSLLQNLSAQYDLVLIDSPPTMLVADSTIISSKVDGILVVLRSQATARPALARVSEQFRRNRANILGFVLNAVNTKSSEYYYSYGYYGDNYHGEESDDKQTS